MLPPQRGIMAPLVPRRGRPSYAEYNMGYVSGHEIRVFFGVANCGDGMNRVRAFGAEKRARLTCED